jgi:hypothetical protein
MAEATQASAEQERESQPRPQKLWRDELASQHRFKASAVSAPFGGVSSDVGSLLSFVSHQLIALRYRPLSIA